MFDENGVDTGKKQIIPGLAILEMKGMVTLRVEEEKPAKVEEPKKVEEPVEEEPVQEEPVKKTTRRKKTTTAE